MSTINLAVLSLVFVSQAQAFVGLCTQGKNPLGTCGCPGNTNQLWINDDCTQVRDINPSCRRFYILTIKGLHVWDTWESWEWRGRGLLYWMSGGWHPPGWPQDSWILEMCSQIWWASPYLSRSFQHRCVLSQFEWVAQLLTENARARVTTRRWIAPSESVSALDSSGSTMTAVLESKASLPLIV